MPEWLTAEALWFLFGALLLIIELLAPGIVFLFFGAGAWLTAIVTFFGDLSVEGQLLLFSSTSVLSLVSLRKMVRQKLFAASQSSNEALDDEFIDHRALAEGDFDSNGNGKVAFRGSSWKARADAPVQDGQEVRIVRKESITLYVEPVASDR